MNEPKTDFHESGLNIIKNPDGSFIFEWDPKDERWSWMNNLTDDQIKTMMESTAELIKNHED
jgi:hypothetical protein